MCVQTDNTRHEKVKADIYKKYPKHRAYRSGLLVKEYEAQGGKYSCKANHRGLKCWLKDKRHTVKPMDKEFQRMTTVDIS